MTLYPALHLENALGLAVTAFDRREAQSARRRRRGCHNHDALAFDLDARPEIVADVMAGVDAREAVDARFSGRLATAVKRAVRDF